MSLTEYQQGVLRRIGSGVVSAYEDGLRQPTLAALEKAGYLMVVQSGSMMPGTVRYMRTGKKPKTATAKEN